MPGMAKLIRSLPAGWSLLQSLQSKLSSWSSPHSTDSDKQNSHKWPDVEQDGSKIQSQVEAFTSHSPSVSSQTEELAHVRTSDIEMNSFWQVDPYLDTSGPEYSWMNGHRPGNSV